LFHYNFPEECKIDFKTINLFGGFLQRLDPIKALSKFSMASMCTLKQEDMFHIYGVWLFRGQERPKEFLKVDDTNYYTWTKVDINDEEHKTRVGDYLSWESLTNWNGLGEYISSKTYAI